MSSTPISMDYETRVIGIPAWEWKKQLLEHAEKHPNIIEMPTLDLCVECSRHFEVLTAFDEGVEDFGKTEYFRYQVSRRKPIKGIVEKIDVFKHLYENIKRDGCYLEYPVITDDGCRLDGSHRLAIAKHLEWETAPVNVARYESIMSREKASEVRYQVKLYRRDVYGL